MGRFARELRDDHVSWSPDSDPSVKVDVGHHLGMGCDVDRVLAILEPDQVKTAPLGSTGDDRLVRTDRHDLDRTAGQGGVVELSIG
jgi:hypothetical protein